MLSSIKSVVGCIVVLFLSATCLGQNMLVKEIKLPKDAKDVTYSKQRGDIRFQMTVDMKAAGESIKAELTAAQWTKPQKDNLQKNFWVQKFAKQGKTLEVRTENRDGGCDVRFTPGGMLWDEDFAPLVKDIPIPKDAMDIKYDDFFEAIEFRHTLAIKELTEFFSTKLDSKVWSVSGADSMNDWSATLKRTSGTATLNISISDRNNQRTVRIKTTGMVWDEIKKANASAEKKKDSNTEMPSSTAKNTSPVRNAKPAKGIEKLDKLVSHCVLTMDGLAINLKEIAAYEVISYGQWKTHVIATAVPIKQEVLLDLLKSNTQEQDWGQKWKLPAPFVKLVLDETDKPDSMQLIANNVPGSESGRQLQGEALVESGRARGTVTMPKGSFFKHNFSVDFTFDVSLLSKDAAPQSRMANAPKLENKGTIVMAGKNTPLPNVVAYQQTQGSEKVTCVLLTEKAIDSSKIKASLEKSGEIDLSVIGFQPQIEFKINANDEVQSVSFYCDGASLSLSGTDKLDSTIQTEGARVRGTTKLKTPQDFFGKKIEFQASFDTKLIIGTDANAGK